MNEEEEILALQNMLNSIRKALLNANEDFELNIEEVILDKIIERK